MSESKKKNTKGASTAKTKRDILIMKDGTKHTIIGEDGRYYRTLDGLFRKVNPNIKEVKKVAQNATEGLTEGE